MGPSNAEVLIYIQEHPGCTCFEISRALDVLPAHVSVELRVLRARNAITSDGNTKGTRYTAVKSAKKR